MSEHDVDESHREPSSNVVIGRGIKMLGETEVPGASLVLDGEILPGAAANRTIVRLSPVSFRGVGRHPYH